MLDGLWKERKEWEEDGRNAGRIVEGKKGMGGRWKECGTVQDSGSKEKNGGKMKEMLDGVWLWKERKEWEEDGMNAGQ